MIITSHRTWRRLLLIRDSRHILPNPESPRMGICVLCGPDVFFRTYQLQAHHIRPRSLYPKLRFLLKNGVMICSGHHQGIVHNHNAAVDVRDKSYQSGWRQFLSTFVRWNRLVDNDEFNDLYDLAA